MAMTGRNPFRGSHLGSIALVVVAVACVVLLALGVVDAMRRRGEPRFFDIEPRPGLVCLYDRIDGQIVAGTCKEAED